MRTVSRTCLFFVALTASCGVISSFVDFDGKHSGVTTSASVAPADGNTPVQVTVSLRYSATVPAKGVPLTIAAVGVPVSFAASQGTTDANGIFATRMTSLVAGSVRLMVNVKGQSGTSALSASVQFSPIASGASLALGPQATVGVPETAVVTILDASGQRVLYYDGTVKFSSSDPLAVLPPVYQFTSADEGQHSFAGITFGTSGTQSLLVADVVNPNISAGVDDIKVYLKTAPMLEVSGLSAALAGTLGNVRVRAVDISNVTQIGYTGTVHFTSTDLLAELPGDVTFTATDAGVKVMPVKLKTAGLQAVSAVDTSNLAINGTQGGIPVLVQADRFSVSAATPVAAGTTASVHIAAVDAYDNVDPNYVGPVILSSSDVHASAPPAHTFTPADAGSRDMNITLYTAGVQTLTAQGSSAAFAGQTAVSVVGAAVERFALLGPLQAIAGTPVALVVTAYDRYGNVSSGYGGVLAVTCSDGHAEFPGTISVTPATAGSAALTPVVFEEAGTQTVTITDANLMLSARAQVSVVNAAAASFAVTGLTSMPAGGVQSVDVAALDAFGNPAVDYTGSVVVSSDDALAQLPATTAFTSQDAGVRVLTPVVLKTAGLRRVQVADVANPNVFGSAPNLLVSPLAASQWVVRTAAQAAAGVPQNLIVRAVDAYGNLDPNYAGSVTLTSSDANASLPAPYTFGPADAGQAHLQATLYSSGAQTLSAGGGGLTSVPAFIDVVSSSTTKLALSGLTSGRAGRAQNLVLQALDDFNNLVPGYVGSVQITSSDNNAVLPTVVTVDASDGGQKLLTVTLLTAGLQSVTAHDVAIPSIAGSQGNILVTAVADRLRIQAPSVLIAGGNFTLGVAGVDAYGNVDTSYTGTVSLSSSGGSTLPATVSIGVGMQGAVSVGGVALLGAGTGQSISAQDTQQPLTGSRTGIWVQPAAAATFAVQAPSSAYVGLPFAATLTAYDAFGNQATGYVGQAVLSSSDPGASLGTIAFVASNQGSATAAGLIWSVASSNASLVATDTQNSNILGAQNGIVVRAGGAAKLRIVGATSGLAGHSDSVSVSALDNSNNIATAYTGTVRLSSSDALAVLPATFTFRGTDAGTHAFTVTWGTAGMQTIAVQDTDVTGLSASQGNILIAARPASALRLVDMSTGTLVAGAARTLQIAAIDSFGNLDSNYLGSVTLTSSDGQATLPASQTFTPSNAGVVTTSYTLGTAGTQWLAASDAGAPALVGNLTGLAVQPSNPVAMQVSGIADALAGTLNSATIEAVDAFANRVPSYTGTAHLSSSDPLAVLSGDLTFRAQDQGSRVAQVTLFTGGPQSVTATATNAPSIFGTQANINVRVSRSRLKIVAPSSVAALQNFTITVAAVDAYGNVDPNYTGNVALTSSDASAFFGAASSGGPGSAASLTFVSGDAGYKALPNVTLAQASANATIGASDGAQSLAGQRSGIVVAAGGIDHLAVSVPASVTPGSPFAAQVSAVDNANNVVTGYTGSLALTSTDGNATLPSSITLASADAGSLHVGNLILVTAGAQTLTLADTHGITGSATTTVAALGPVALRVSGATSGVAGHTDSITVTAVDAFGNPANGNVGVITFSSSDAQAVLPSPYALGSAGTHTFAGVQFATAGTQTLRASATPPAGAILVGQQNDIVIQNDSATRYVFLGLQDTTAGLAQNVRLGATDAYGNLDPTFAGNVGLTSSDASATVPATITLAAGQASFAATLVTAGAQMLSASGSGLSGTSPSVTVAAAAPSRLAVSGIAGGVAGQSASVTLAAFDSYNNPATGYLGMVTLSSSDPLAALPAIPSFGPADAGVKNAAVVFFTPGTQTLTATDTMAPSITGQQSGIVITAGQRFVLTGPATIGAGQPLSVTVQAVDNSNNVDTSFVGMVHFSSTDARATLPTDVTFAAGDLGQKSVAGFALATAGAQTGIMAATLPAGRSGALYPIAVTMAAATGFTVSAPSSVTAGGNFNVTISATDSYGNIVPGYTGTAVMTSNDPNATLAGSVVLAAGDAGTKTIGATLRRATSAASLTATDSSNPSFTGQQGNITVSPLANVSSLTLTGLTPGAAGHTNTATLTARDIYGNAVPQYRGTVNFSSSDALATLPANYTFIGADRGTHAFSGVVLATVGNQTLTAADAARSVSQTVAIAPAAATFFALNTNSSAISGQAQNVTIIATDAYGNVDINYAGTVTLTSHDPMALLPASYTFVALDAGRRVLPVTLQSAGTQSLNASAPDGAAGMQGGIVVNPGATSRLSISGIFQPSTGNAVSINVRALDAAGNTTPAYRGTTHITSSDASATLPADYTYTSGAGGQHSASVTFATAGNQSLTVTDTATPSIQGSLANIAVAAPAVRLRLALAGNTTAGAATPLVVQVTDNFNNLATAYSGTILLSTSDAQATYATQVTLAPADQGNKVVAGIFKTAGPQSIAAVDAQGALLGATSTVSVAPGATDHYDIGAPVSVAAGGNILLTLVARDAYSNSTPSYSGTAHLTCSDATAALPGNVTVAAGNATFGPARATLASAATTFTATDTAHPSIAGTSPGVAVLPLAPSALGVSGATSGAAGHTQSVTVSARDIYNNLAPSYRGGIALRSSDAAAALPPNYVFVASDAGSHTFTGLVLVTAGNQTIAAADTIAPSIAGAQSNIAIVAGAATQMLVTGPASATAGSSQAYAVSAVDAYGNRDTGFAGVVTFTGSDAQASPPAPYTFVGGDAGNHNLVATLVTAGTQSLGAQSPGLVAGQTSVVVLPAATSAIAVAGLTTAPAGTPQTLSVRAIDNYNNTTPTYRGTMAFTSTDARASLPGNTAFLASDAGGKSLTTTLLTRGAQQVRATDTLNPNLVGAQNVWVSVQQTQLTVVTDTHVTAGVAFNVTLSATDAYGNINPNYTGTVHLTSSDPNATLPGDVTFVSGNQGSVTLTRQTVFRTAGSSQTLSATDAAYTFVGSQTGIAVGPGPAATLVVTPPSSVTAGTPFTVGVAAADAYGNLATTYTGHIAFAASDANATLPPTSTFTLGNLGSKTFANGFRLVSAGSQIISVTDVNSLITGSTATQVQSAAPSTLVLNGPANAVAGSPLTLALVAYDAFGNTATSMSDTVNFSGSDAAGTYPGATPFVPADAGTKTFTGLTTLRTAGLVSITVSDATVSGVTPAIIYVLVAPASAASLVVSAPAAVTAASSFSATVAAVDAYLNVVRNYAATVQVTSTDPSGLPSSSTPFPVSFVAGSAAQRTLSNLRLMTAGAQLLSAVDPNNSGVFGSVPIQVNPGPAIGLSLATAANATAGQPVDVTVAALDAGGNLAPTFVGSVTFSSTDAQATLPPSATFAAADHGQKTLSASLAWHRAGNQNLTAASSGLSSATAQTAVSAAGVVGLRLFGIGNLLAGASNPATLRAVDAFGNTAPTYRGTVTWSSSDPAASLPGPLTFAAADAGIKSTSVRLYTAGAQSVSITDSVNNYSATQANIVVGVQRSRFVVTSPNTTSAGSAITLTVAATDAYGNLDANYTGALHFVSSDANASLPTGISILGADHGQKSVANVVLTTATSNANVTVLDNTNTLVGTTGAIAVTPANANRLTVSTAASTAAGSPLTAVVTAYDAYANVATAYTGTVALSTTNANAILPGNATFASNGNGVSTIPNIYLLEASNSSSVTATDTLNPGITGTRAGIQVTPLAIDHFVVSGLTSGAAGHTSALLVVARDAYNNVATGYRGTVSFTSSDLGASLPLNYAFAPSDQGSHSFAAVSLATVGNQSVTVRDSVQAGVMGTQSGIVITGNSASHLALTGAATTVAGQAQNILVAAVDAYGNIDPNFTATVNLSTSDPNATVPSSYTFAPSDAGTHLVSVTYTTAATQTLTATGPAAVGTTQINTVVSPGNANAYLVSGIPNAPAGQAISATVRAIDAYNNTVPLYRGRAHLSSSDANAQLPGDYTFVAGDNGVKALGITLTTAGTQWVRATDTNVPSITGQQNNIQVGVAQSHLQVTCNTNVVAGTGFSVAVTAVDAYGNLNTGYTGAVHFTSGDVNAVLPGNANIVAANNGSITVPGFVLRGATANQSITATDTNVASYTGAQTGIQVNPASANTFMLSGPATAVAGASFTAAITAYDAFNNVATGYTGSVAFASSDANATLPSPTAFGSAYAGSHAFANAFALVHAGNQNITAIDTNNALTAQLSVTVGAAAPAALVLASPATSTAGNVIPIALQAQDAYGNLAPSYRGTVTFSSGDPCASYPPNYAFVSADNGSHAFNTGLTLRQSGSQVINAVDANNPAIGAGAAVIAVNSAPLVGFRVSAPGTVTSESSFIASVTGLDVYGNTANTYAGTVRLTSSDPNGTPSTTAPLNLAFTNGASVQRSVSGLLLNSGGNQTLYARDANNPNTLNGQANVIVLPLAATTLSLSGFPASLTAGQQGNIVVRAYDNYGNIAIGYTGTVHFSSTDAHASLSPNYTFVPADQGTHLFTGLSLHTVGNAQAISAADANGVSGTQTPIIVTPASPNALSLTGPASGVAGTAFSVVATALDAYGNVATSYGDTITFTSSNGNALKPANYTFGSGNAGTHTFGSGVTIYLSGSQNVTITDSSARTATLTVAMTSANAYNLLVTAPASTVAGTVIDVSLAAYDIYGNLATGIGDSITFTSSDVAATLPAPYTFTGGDSGSHVFHGNTILRKSGVHNVTATDTTTGSVLASSANVTVSPNVTVAFLVNVPATVQPALPYKASIISQDAYGNVVPTYSGTANITSSDANGTPPISPPLALTFTGTNNGSITLNNLRLKALGTQILTATDSVTPSITGSGSTTVQDQTFTTTYYFNPSTQPNYVYDANRIVVDATYAAALKPIYTTVGDSNATSFGAGTSQGLLWDNSNNYLRLAPSGATRVFFSMLEYSNVLPTWNDSIDTNNRGISNVSSIFCDPNGYNYNSVAGSLLFGGTASGGASTYAYMKLWDLSTKGITIDANSQLTYALYPQDGNIPVGGNSSVNGNNTLSTAVNLVFTDGTDLAASSVTDANGVLMNPASQGAGGKLLPNTWNYVNANLAPLAGKTIDHISLGWQSNGATGGFRGWLDDVSVSGTAVLSNPAGLDASWTPHYNALVAYWNFDGRGPLVDNSNIAAVVGPPIKVSNPDGWDVNYVDGKVGQAVSVDGYGYSFSGGYLTSTGSFTSHAPFTLSFWLSTNAYRAACASSVLLSNTGDSGSIIRFVYDLGNCGVDHYIGCYNSGTSCGYSDFFPGTVDTWQHYAMTQDGNAFTLYVDGAPVSAGTPNVPPPITNFLGIGRTGGNRNIALFIDELAIWSLALNPNEIAQIYGRQAATYSGSMTSQVYSSPTMAGADTALLWNSTLPTSKGLPSGSASEAPSAYSGLTSSSLNSNLIGSWHFEETVLQTVSGGDFFDDSRSGNVAYTWQSSGNLAVPGVPGITGRAVGIAGNNSGITVKTAYASPNIFTLSVWFKSNSGGGRLFGFSDAQAAGQGSFDRHIYLGSDGLAYFGVCPPSGCVVINAKSFSADNRWHHAVATLSGAGMALYLDGSLAASNSGITTAYTYPGLGYWTLGNAVPTWVKSGGYFSGRLDEAAVWSRALTAAEVQVLYRRGIDRLKLQVRGCLNSTCSDAPPWQGYDGLPTSYVTEVQNALNGNILNVAPALPLSRALPAIALNPNAYLQYRAVLESDDARSGCIYNGQRMACSPEVQSIGLARMNYDTSSPTVGNANAATPYYSLQGFSSSLGAAGCAGGVRYALSPDRTNYYYYTAGSWTASNLSPAQSNTPSDLTSGAMQAFSNTFPFGATYFQALLTSNGSTPCALSSVGWQGTQ